MAMAGSPERLFFICLFILRYCTHLPKTSNKVLPGCFYDRLVPPRKGNCIVLSYCSASKERPCVRATHMWTIHPQLEARAYPASSSNHICFAAPVYSKFVNIINLINYVEASRNVFSYGVHLEFQMFILFFYIVDQNFRSSTMTKYVMHPTLGKSEYC